MNVELTHLYLRLTGSSSKSAIEEAIAKGITNFILDEDVKVKEIETASYFHLSKTSALNEVRIASTIADCMNAEREKAVIILWDTNEFSDLESLIPIKAPYGWMILSLNTPVLINLDKVKEEKDLENIDLAGFYSDKLEDLVSNHFNIENIKSE